MKTRKVLVIAGGAVLAFAVAAHYARWQWAIPGGATNQSRATGDTGHETCGRVASVYHDTRGEGQPTFIDLGHDYPNQDVTILIWQRDIARFDPPPESWQGQSICVTGHIRTYKGSPEIIAYGPGQVRIRE